ncbi:YqiA/YcfP family alpha/beta fold hydrolase [Methylomonas sp. MgM2]
MQKAIVYLHGFNSASLDSNGNLLISKDKLRVMQAFCAENGVFFYAPNVDYRDFQNLVGNLSAKRRELSDHGYEVIFMGSSMGGFASEYMAMKTGCKAIMINPVPSPTELLPQFIGIGENYETGQPYSWHQAHCEQYARYEAELAHCTKTLDRTILLDLADELLDSEKTISKYKAVARVVSFDGGSHSFEHMREALPVVERAIRCPEFPKTG